MYGRWPHADSPAGHNLYDSVHLLLEFRSTPSGPEIVLAHGFKEKRQRCPVHVEEVFNQRIGRIISHMGHDAEIKHRVPVAKVTHIYPIYLTLSYDNVTRIKVSMQACSSGLQLVYIAHKPRLDIVRNILVGGNI